MARGVWAGDECDGGRGTEQVTTSSQSAEDPARWTPEAWQGYPAMQEFLWARAEGRPYRSPNAPDKLDRAALRRQRRAQESEDEESMAKKQTEKKAKAERQLKQPDRAVIMLAGPYASPADAESVTEIAYGRLCTDWPGYAGEVQIRQLSGDAIGVAGIPQSAPHGNPRFGRLDPPLSADERRIHAEK